MMDLADLLGGEMPEKPKPLVDLSGRPQPTRAWVTLTNGIVVEAEIRYRGLIPNGDRGFRVIAEIDWAKDNVATIEVDRWPPDVQVTLLVPDDLDDERCRQIGTFIQWKVAGEDRYPKNLTRQDSDGGNFRTLRP